MNEPRRTWSVFTNPEDGRPRAGWRLLLHLFVLMLLLSFWQLALQGWPGHGNLLYLVYGGFITLSVWIAAQLFDRRKFKEYGLKLSPQWYRDCLFGIVLGLVSMSILFFVYWSAGWAEFNGWGWERAHNRDYFWVIGGYFVMMIAVGFYEELVFRGYQTKNLAEALMVGKIDNNKAAFIAVAVTSVFFGVMHYSNPNATVVSTINISIAGIMLGLPYILTNSLALPIGLHFSWNFFQGGVFGFPVSGNPPRESLIQIVIDGPQLITGGSFGPEGGVTGAIMIIILIIVVLYYYRQMPMPKASPEFTAPPELFDTPKISTKNKRV